MVILALGGKDSEVWPVVVISISWRVGCVCLSAGQYISVSPQPFPFPVEGFQGAWWHAWSPGAHPHTNWGSNAGCWGWQWRSRIIFAHTLRISHRICYHQPHLSSWWMIYFLCVIWFIGSETDTMIFELFKIGVEPCPVFTTQDMVNELLGVTSWVGS